MAGGSKRKEKGSKKASSKPKKSSDRNNGAFLEGGNPFQPGTKNYKKVQEILRSQYELSEKGSGDRRLKSTEPVTIGGLRELADLCYGNTDKKSLELRNLLCRKPIQKGISLESRIAARKAQTEKMIGDVDAGGFVVWPTCFLHEITE